MSLSYRFTGQNSVFISCISYTCCMWHACHLLYFIPWLFLPIYNEAPLRAVSPISHTSSILYHNTIHQFLTIVQWRRKPSCKANVYSDTSLHARWLPTVLFRRKKFLIYCHVSPHLETIFPLSLIKRLILTHRRNCHRVHWLVFGYVFGSASKYFVGLLVTVLVNQTVRCFHDLLLTHSFNQTIIPLIN